MAKQQLTSLAAKLILDTRQFEDGTTASRKELNTIRKAMQDTETPLEKYERKMADLGDVLKKDSRFQETYNRKAKQFKDELDKAERAAKGFTDELDDMGDELQRGPDMLERWSLAIIGLNQGLELTSKAFGLVQGAMDSLTDLDRQIFELRRFGIGVEYFGALKVIAAESRVEIEDVADLIKDVGVRIGEAAKGDGIDAVFKELGLDAAKLIALDPVAQLEAMAQAIGDIDNRTRQSQIADELYGDNGTRFLENLLSVPDAIEKASKAAEEMGIDISKEDAANIDQAAKAMQTFYLAWDGFATSFKINVAPYMTTALQMVTTAMNLPGLSEGKKQSTFGEAVGAAGIVLTDGLAARQGPGPMAADQGIRDRIMAQLERNTAAQNAQTEVLEGIKNNQETLTPSPANIGQ